MTISPFARTLLMSVSFLYFTTMVRADDLPKNVQSVLTSYCVDCHGGTSGKGNVRLADLAKLPLAERLPLLNQVQEQLFFKMMPPAKAEQPTAAELTTLRDWVRGELRKHHASKLDDKMPYPDAGNYVDHEALFHGRSQDKPSSPARRWLVSPGIFHERMLDLFQLQGREREQFKRSGFHGITNPFVLPDHAGVRYYDLTPLDGGHLLVMRTNAEWIATKQLHAARVKAGNAPVNPDPKDRWFPKETPAAFATIVLKSDAPSDAEIDAAVQTQFTLALQRAPTPREQDAYRELTRTAIKLGGNAEGLRHMLLAVLLESELLYRYEFGAGVADEHGRQLLAPREAAQAIAYALGDRGPDAVLLKAAAEGRLTTKADFEREVRRLLADENYNRGPIDATLGQQVQTVVANPRSHRFFRDFFGYPAAVKVFKDVKRSGGVYINADRGSTQTPGYLINEADQLVAWVLAQDKNVFTQLLTTDRYFVYHTLDNQKGAERIAGWKQVYETLKGTDWRKNPVKVAEDHQELLKKHIDPKGVPGKSTAARHDNSIVRWMTHFEYTFGQGITPHTTPPWAHGNHHWYSPIYNLPRTPGRDTKYGGDDRLDFQPVQPFALPNRKGLLTHPAWLVAFSSNFHNDTVRRGRWIREKLLAGYVPDVPITVDAKVPDDATKTFRERLEQVTAKAECAKCHQHMNPLGMPLESYDDFGRFRTVELLEHPDSLLKARPGNESDLYKTKPVVATGVLTGTGDPKLDGPVTDAFDLIDRLAQATRVRQSIIRHAFRFYMGRNETLADAATLQEADRAYLQSGGSFKAVIIALLTSDSFMYRKKTGTNP